MRARACGTSGAGRAQPGAKTRLFEVTLGKAPAARQRAARKSSPLEEQSWENSRGKTAENTEQRPTASRSMSCSALTRPGRRFLPQAGVCLQRAGPDLKGSCIFAVISVPDRGHGRSWEVTGGRIGHGRSWLEGLTTLSRSSRVRAVGRGAEPGLRWAERLARLGAPAPRRLGPDPDLVRCACAGLRPGAALCRVHTSE